MPGPDFTLRPLASSDRDRLLAWRNSDRVRSQMFSTAIIAPDQHRRWFATAIAADPSTYRILELNGEPLGFAAFHRDEQHPGRCTWGIYIGAADAPRGAGTALGELALDHAFATLGASVVRSEAMESNERALRLYDRLGFQRTGSRKLERDPTVGPEEIVVLEIDAGEWRRRRRVR